MTAARNKSKRAYARPQSDYVVDYSDEVTLEQAEKLTQYVHKEFERGNWVTVEQDS
ncbi:MAG: hypothetical protein H0V18_05885 [Pyrinomonadaceae bacterium]|nr:hypothetical protein [Pyrinomonadaceae bacterium]